MDNIPQTHDTNQPGLAPVAHSARPRGRVTGGELLDRFTPLSGQVFDQVSDQSANTDQLTPANNLMVENAALQQALTLAREEWGKTTRENRRLQAELENNSRKKLNQRITELEQAPDNARTLYQQSVAIAEERARIAEEERDLAQAQAKANSQNALLLNIGELEQTIQTLRKANDKQSTKRLKQDNQKITDLENKVTEQQQAIESHVRYRLEQGAAIVALKNELREARAQTEQGTTTPDDDTSKILAQYKRAITDVTASLNASCKRECDWRHQKDQAVTERDQALARNTELESKLTEALAQSEQNAHITEDAHQQHRAILNDNTCLLAFIESKGLSYERETTELSGIAPTYQDAEGSPRRGTGNDAHEERASGQVPQNDKQTGRDHQPVSRAYRNAQAVLSRYQGISSTAETTELVAALDQLLQFCEHLRGLHQFDEKYVQEFQSDRQWDQRKSASPVFEPATKEAIKYLREVTKGKKDSYTPIYRADVAKAIGVKDQAAGRHLKLIIDSGIFSGYKVAEKAMVPDKRLGTREIEKEILHVAPCDIVERPEDWQRADGKKHGGSLPRCRRCQAENTLRKVHHTVCLSCGYEDILMPLDAQAAIDRNQNPAIEDGDELAAVAEATTIVTQVSEVQDELQSNAQPIHPEPASLTRIVEATEDPQITEVHLELQSDTALEAVETLDTPEEHDTRMLRHTASSWADIEAKDHGCWVPDEVISYWRTQGRIYQITKPVIEEARPVAIPAPTPIRTRKVVDLNTGSVRDEVQG